MVVTGPVGKHFGNLESYPVHNQIHGLVLIESKSLVKVKNPLSTKWSVDKKLSSQTNEQMCVGIPIYKYTYMFAFNLLNSEFALNVCRCIIFAYLWDNG